jgi:hypothetical protein
MSKLIVLAAAALAFICSADASAQSTLPELARANPGEKIVRGIRSDIPPTSIEGLTAGATLIVDATLTKTKSYLSPDENYVRTDYQIVPSHVLAGQVPVSKK